MTLNLQRETILKPLLRVVNVIENNPTLPILSNVLIQIEDNYILVKGTDLEIELISKNKLIHQNSNQTLTLPAKKLVDICKSLPQDATLEMLQDKEQINIRSGKSSFKLSTLPSQKFPEIEGKKEHVKLQVVQKDFKKLLQRTAFAMAQNDVRYYLNGILLEITQKSVKAIATDGHRLALNSIETKNNLDHRLQIIVPRKAVVELIRLLQDTEETVDLLVGSNFIKVFHPSYIFTSKLIEGRFPNYQKVIPKDNNITIKMNRSILKDALSRTSILCNEKFRGIKLAFNKNQILLLANNPEHEAAKEELTVDYTHEPFDICFNVNYLIENLNIIESEMVHLSLSDAANSLLIEEPDNYFGSVFVVMPMRL